MASRTLIDLVKTLTSELQLGAPVEVLTSTDQTVVQLISLLRAACEELCELHTWQSLLRIHSFTTTNGTASYALPPDLQRFVSNTGVDSDGNSLLGSLSPTDAAHNVLYPIGSNSRFQIAGDKLVLYPTPTTAKTFKLTYVSSAYVVGPDGTRQTEFEEDTDRVVFPSRLVLNFTKLKFLESKGLGTISAANDYNASLNAALAADTPAGVIHMIAWGDDPPLPNYVPPIYGPGYY